MQKKGRVRPIYFKELGDLFVSERERRAWNQSDAAAFAKRRGLSGLTRHVLLRLEQGQIKHPRPEVLKAVASIYDLRYADIVRLFVEAQYGVAPETGGAADVATLELENRQLRARIAELEAYKRIATELPGKLAELIGLIEAVHTRATNTTE